ncbi:MAG: PhzF family phenazine biosynthesis protein [Candidatus Krumholzibacteriota bacterium]|nr:PhzF family phenazine biosynthesis protein [Candidatus Krumholzibacteriota bacterium]
MIRKLVYEHVDVFTDKPFRGNQLAVFPNPGKLTKVQMQQIAREINFSETTFVFAAKTSDAEAKVRIFTPAEEIPFAGHPTLGTAFVLIKKKKGKKPSTLNLELDVGTITVDVAKSTAKETKLTMHQPVPEFGSALQNRGQAARAVGVKGFDLLGGGVVSNGMAFLIVEVRDSEVVSSCKLNIEEAVSVMDRHKVNGIYIFSRKEGKKINVHARFFAPSLAVPEDPATGSAAGALGGYLARIFKFPPNLKLVIEQGKEMNRASLLEVDVDCDRGMVHAVKVSGNVVHVGEGSILIP